MTQQQTRLRLKPIAQLVFASVCVMGAHFAFAADQAQPQAAAPASDAAAGGDLGSVQSSATWTAGADGAHLGSAKKSDSAPAQAPTQGSLSATQPISIINQNYIKNSTPPTANFTDIMQVAPSVSTINPNGPGLMETTSATIRGFADGQYNVTFDGLPFGDSNDFTHHSTSFFSTQTIGSIAVDRGPGDASQIGFATFGGTVAISSIEPSLTPGVSLLGSYGSWNTWMTGATVNTGDLQQWGDARIALGYNHSASDGALTNAAQRRDNIFFKMEKPLGADTLLTVYADYNKVFQNVPLGATAEQIAKYGPNFGLSNDPSSQAFSGYNFDRINTDFEYIGLHTLVGGWTLDNKLYTYGYYHDGFNGMDVNGNTPNGGFTNPAFGANDVPGIQMANNYRSWGDVFNAEKKLGPGTVQAGMLLMRQTNYRMNENVDDSLNFALDQMNDTMTDSFVTFQPYVQYAWQLPYGLTLTPGVKFVTFSRSIDTPMNQKTGQPFDYSHTWTKALPTLTLHDKINNNWSAYAQYAQGFLAPNLNQFYVRSAANQPDPEQTDNYQLGTAYKTDRMTLSADLYYINFRNKTGSRTTSGVTTFFNAGGATYKGFEAEGTYYVGAGLSLYGNFSINSARDKADGTWMPNTPKETAAVGAIYDRGPWHGSVIGKFIGRQYGDTGNQQPIGGYMVTNLAAAYTLKSPTPWMKNVRLGLELDNLFDRRSINGLAGYTADNTPLYWTIPGRAVFATLQTDF